LSKAVTVASWPGEASPVAEASSPPPELLLVLPELLEVLPDAPFDPPPEEAPELVPDPELAPEPEPPFEPLPEPPPDVLPDPPDAPESVDSKPPLEVPLPPSPLSPVEDVPQAAAMVATRRAGARGTSERMGRDPPQERLGTTTLGARPSSPIGHASGCTFEARCKS
jgi:hypothetical protein